MPGVEFTLAVDGESRSTVIAGGEKIVVGLNALQSSTLFLGGLPEQCRVNTPNPILTNGSVPVSFNTQCTTSPIDTIVGRVETTALPTPVAMIHAADNSGALRVTGVLSPELVRLSGMEVRAYGVRSGTSIDIFGYAIQHTASEPRWVGIVTVRNGTLWLFGNSAIQLVDPPPTLTALAGALVWVGGDEVNAIPTRVVPRIFGVIRQALQ
jgi:hypothetical protein